MRVAVTGATGFIGRATVAALAGAGHAVLPLGRPGVDLLRDDTGPWFAQHRPEVLLHLAWYAVPGRFWHAPENLDWTAASLRLVRAFADAGGRRFIGAGSCAEYDWSHPLLREAETPLRPHTLYGAAKARLFELLAAAAPTLGLSVAWGRVFFPYGPGEAPGRLFSGLVDGLGAGEPVAVSEGSQCRDFLHVDDLGDAFARLVASEIDGAVNLASGETVPVRDFTATVARLMGRPDLVRQGARPTQPGEPPMMAADVARLLALDFSPRFDLASGLADAVARRRALSHATPAR